MTPKTELAWDPPTWRWNQPFPQHPGWEPLVIPTPTARQVQLVENSHGVFVVFCRRIRPVPAEVFQGPAGEAGADA